MDFILNRLYIPWSIPNILLINNIYHMGWYKFYVVLTVFSKEVSQKLHIKKSKYKNPSHIRYHLKRIDRLVSDKDKTKSWLINDDAILSTWLTDRWNKLCSDLDTWPFILEIIDQILCCFNSVFKRSVTKTSYQEI
jgi:hypothetical protein